MHLFGIGIGGEGDALRERYIFLSSSFSFLFFSFFFLLHLKHLRPRFYVLARTLCAYTYARTQGEGKRLTLFSFPDSVEFAAAAGNAALMHFHSCIRD